MREIKATDMKAGDIVLMPFYEIKIVEVVTGHKYVTFKYYNMDEDKSHSPYTYSSRVGKYENVLIKGDNDD